MYDDDVTWINQKLYSFKDVELGSNNTVELSLTTNTKNNIDFSPPGINFTIICNDMRTRKVINLSYHEIYDIYETINDLFKYNYDKLYTDQIDVSRKKQTKMLSIRFKETRIAKGVMIGIFFSGQDYLYITVKENIFKGILAILKNYIDSYINISYNFAVRNMMGNMMDEMKYIKQTVLSLSSSINNLGNNQVMLDTTNKNNIIHDSEPVSNIDSDFEKVDKLIIETQSNLQSELKDYLGGNEISNIKIETLIEDTGELLIEKENITEVKSKFVEDVLKYDITNMTEIFDAISINENPLFSFIDYMEKQLDLEGKICSNITDEEKKGISYVTKFIHGFMSRNYIVNKKRINISGLPDVHYNEVDIDDDVVSLSYDLMSLSLYVSQLCNKLSYASEDSETNKEFLYLSFRMFSDFISLTYLSNINYEVFKNNILDRYEYFKSKNTFDKYDKLLSDNNIKEITRGDIISEIDVIFKRFENKMYIKDYLNKTYKSNLTMIPFKNHFTLEQILNEVVVLEIADKFEKITTKEIIFNYIDTPSDEVIDLFINRKDPKLIETKIKQNKEIKDKKEIQTNVVRFITQFRNEIPENIRDQFINLISTEYSNIEFDFKKHKNDYEFYKFGENVIKALYVWNPIENKKTTFSYKDFYSRVENSCLDVNLFLTQLDTEDQKDEESSIYSNFV